CAGPGRSARAPRARGRGRGPARRRPAAPVPVGRPAHRGRGAGAGGRRAGGARLAPAHAAPVTAADHPLPARATGRSRYDPAMRIALLASLALSTAACTTHDSDSILTSGIYASLGATATGDGTTTA